MITYDPMLDYWLRMTAGAFSLTLLVCSHGNLAG
jgi:hypothetical protein